MDNFAYLTLPSETDLNFVEYIPVDDFFDEYLETLNFADDGGPAAGMGKGARIDGIEHPGLDDLDWMGSNTLTDAYFLPDNGTQVPLPISAAPLPPVAHTVMGDPGPQYSPQPGSNTSSGYGTVTSTGQQYSMPVVTSVQALVGSPIITSAVFGNAVISGVPNQLPDRRVPQPKAKRKRVRDERQQMLNKLAQLRYRDRARLKVEVLQGEVGGMEAQLTTLCLAQDANDVLAEKNRVLEDGIKEKEAAIERIRADMMSSGGTTSGGSSGGTGELESSDSAGSGRRGVAGLPADAPESLQTLVKEWLKKSHKIMDLVALMGLGESNKKPIGRMRNEMRRGVRRAFSSKTRDHLDNSEQHMAELVNAVTTLCMRVLRLQGAHVEQLMNADYDMVCSLRGWKNEAKWVKAAYDIGLSPEQRAQMLAVRTETLTTLERLFAERRQLNADVLNSLQPQLFDGAATVDGRDAAPALLAIMDKLSTNLRDEQRSLAELDYTMFTKLLTPIQGGLLVTLSFPDHCDGLALLNAIEQTTAGIKPGLS